MEDVSLQCETAGVLRQIACDDKLSFFVRAAGSLSLSLRTHAATTTNATKEAQTSNFLLR